MKIYKIILSVINHEDYCQEDIESTILNNSDLHINIVDIQSAEIREE